MLSTLAVLTVVLFPCGSALAVDYSWNSASDLWNAVGAWNPNGVPGQTPPVAGDTVSITRDNTTLTLAAAQNVNPTLTAFTLDGGTRTNVDFTGVTITVNGPSTIKKAGKFTLTNVTWDGTGRITNSIDRRDGAIFIRNLVRIKSSFSQGGAIEISTVSTDAASTILTVDKDFTNAGAIWLNQLTNANTPNSAAILKIGDGTGQLTNTGRIIFEPSNGLFSREIKGQIINTGSITVDANTRGYFGQDPAGGEIANTGKVTIGKNSELVYTSKFRNQIGGVVEGSGFFRASGALAGVVEGSGPFRASGGVTVFSSEGGKIRPGVVFDPGAQKPAQASLASPASVDPKELGVLTFAGDYAGDAEGSLDIQIGGSVLDISNDLIQYDRLAVTENVRSILDGTLNVSLVNGYDPLSDPTPDLHWDILTSDGGISNFFSNASSVVTTTDGLAQFNVTYIAGSGSPGDPGIVRLTNFEAVPEPTAGLLMALALSVGLGRRRRRLGAPSR